MVSKPIISVPKAKSDDRYVSTAGYQRNNPGNIMIRNIPYQGKAHDQPKSGPILFTDQQSGLRALAMDVKMKLKHSITLQDYVSKYAPTKENDTESYTQYLSDELGIEANHNVPNDDNTHLRLMDAIIKYEIGYGQNPYSDADLKQAIQDAKTPSASSPKASNK